MSSRLCEHVGFDEKIRIIFCWKQREKDPQRITAAPCMMDPHSAAYIKQELCEDFKESEE